MRPRPHLQQFAKFVDLRIEAVTLARIHLAPAPGTARSIPDHCIGREASPADNA